MAGCSWSVDRRCGGRGSGAAAAHSYLSASTGSRPAACRAGRKPATMPTRSEEKNARAIPGRLALAGTLTVAATGADGLAGADLPDPLADRDEHRVRDPYPAHHQGDRRDADEEVPQGRGLIARHREQLVLADQAEVVGRRGGQPVPAPQG